MTKKSGEQMRSFLTKFAVLVILILGLGSLGGCQSIDLANLENMTVGDVAALAAEFCEQNGGSLDLRVNPNTGEFSVCSFPDGSECSPEAFRDGECQAGKYFGSQQPDDITALSAPHCEQNGGTWQNRQNSQGGMYGVCVFEDNSECEAGAFYRGECAPGQMSAYPGPNGPQNGKGPGGPVDIAAEAAPYCIQNGGTWQIRKNAQGEDFGVCVFEDKSECEGSAFYRGDCKPGQTFSAGPNSPQGATGLANPASQYCAQNGGTLQLRTDSSGGQYGVCLFSDGTECEEWAFFRGECKPGNSAQQEGALNRHTYSNATFGFNLDAPAGWTVREAANMVQFKYQAYTLSIGFWPPDQTPPQIRQGFPSGDFQNGGQYTISGMLFQKRYLVQNGQVKMVDFGNDLNLGSIHLSIWLEGPNGQGRNASEIPAEIIAEAEAILNSISFNW